MIKKFQGTLILASLCCGMASSAQAQLRYVGSDSVEPVIEAAHGSFMRGHPDFKLQLQTNGSSSGLRELCTGRAALAGSSRPIKTDEQHDCTAAGITPMEIPIALDAVALIVSRKNTWLQDLTLAELRNVFAPASAGKLMQWKQLRPGFPDQRMKTVGVGIKHGTFQFFVEAIGNAQFVRSDFKDSHGHAETVKWVAADPGAIGFVPLATIKDFDSEVRAIAIDFGKGPVEPSRDTLIDGRYSKLGRQVYLYANPAALAKPSVEKDFIKFLLTDLERYVAYANLTPLQSLQYQETLRRASFVG